MNHLEKENNMDKMGFDETKALRLIELKKEDDDLDDWNYEETIGFDKMVSDIINNADNKFDTIVTFLKILPETYLRFALWNEAKEIAENENLKIPEFRDQNLNVRELGFTEEFCMEYERIIEVGETYSEKKREIDDKIWSEFVEPIFDDKDKLKSLYRLLPTCVSQYKMMKKIQELEGF